MRRACATTLHILGPDGSVRTGADAVLFLAEHTAIGAPARCARFAPVLWVLERLYGVVARNRRFFARFLFTRE